MAAAVARTRVHAQWEGLALASEAVVHAPVLACGFHEQIQAAAVRQLAACGLVAGLRVLDK